METQLERNNLIMKLRNEKITIPSIAKILNMSFYTCAGILRRRKGILDGRDFKRELIRKYFNHTCQKCKRIWQQGERRFDVHHWGEGSSKSKSYEDWADLDKVSLFCHRCHLNLLEHRQTMKENHKPHKS